MTERDPATDQDRVRAGDRRVEVSRPDKVLFGDPGITKAELAGHYRLVARRTLPHVRGHPLALQRFPDGIGSDGFMQKKVPAGAPDWIRRATVDREGGGSTTMVCGSDTAGLVWLADQAVVTPHCWLSRADAPRRPTRMIFDLDPPDGDFGPVRWAAGALRDLLGEMNLAGYPMTTGSRGVHVVLPLSGRDDVDDVRDVARAMADLLADRHPDRLTTRVRVADRHGRLFVDILRNAYAQHAVAPYAPRARPGAPVATPIGWDELDDPGLTAGRWRLRDIPGRLSEVDDPWRGMGRRAVALSTMRRRLPRH